MNNSRTDKKVTLLPHEEKERRTFYNHAEYLTFCVIMCYNERFSSFYNNNMCMNVWKCMTRKYKKDKYICE